MAEVETKAFKAPCTLRTPPFREQSVPHIAATACGPLCAQLRLRALETDAFGCDTSECSAHGPSGRLEHLRTSHSGREAVCLGEAGLRDAVTGF